MLGSKHTFFFTLFLLFASGIFVRASDPIYTITYDTPKTVACKEVERLGNKMTILVRLPVSIKFRGDSAALTEVSLGFKNNREKMLVVDFLPKTTLITESGVIQYEKIKDKNGDLKIRFSEPKVGSVDASGNIREQTKETFSKLPPKKMVLASGFANRQFGCFFKLKPSTQTSIEGQHDFACLMEVDSGWRGDYLFASFNPDSNRWLSGGKDQNYSLGLHLENDEDAKKIVERSEAVSDYYLQIDQLKSKVKELESNRLYPYFGYGSEAEKNRQQIRSIENKYKEFVDKIDKLNSK
jgi:hypothetical protein